MSVHVPACDCICRTIDSNANVKPDSSGEMRCFVINDDKAKGKSMDPYVATPNKKIGTRGIKELLLTAATNLKLLVKSYPLS